MIRDPKCKAYQTGGQMFCPECGLNWDADDDDPPECRDPDNIPATKRKPVPRNDRHPIGGSL